MILAETNLNRNILEIKKELNLYKDYARDEFFTYCINEKLKSTLRKYEIELNNSEAYLINRRCNDVLKTITKIQKEQDKKDLDELVEKEGIDE